MRTVNRRSNTASALIAWACAVVFGGCVVEVDEVGATYGALGAFDRHRIVDDDDFVDHAAYAEPDLQRMFEDSPWGRSFLADYRLPDGRSAARAVAEVAREHRLNPLTILATLQKESSLVSQTRMPSREKIDFAFGCGCFDGQPCREEYRGLDKQLACAGKLLRSEYDDAVAGRPTNSGLKTSQAFRDLGGVSVTPANHCTTSLYTYTPWVLERRGGNWLFWNVWHRLAGALSGAGGGGGGGAEPPGPAPGPGAGTGFNPGAIGGACASDASCDYRDASCDTVFGQSFCSAACTEFCPDSHGATGSFCVRSPVARAGMCVAECDPSLADGCPDGFSCRRLPRFGQTNVQKRVCVPEAS